MSKLNNNSLKSSMTQLQNINTLTHTTKEQIALTYKLSRDNN